MDNRKVIIATLMPISAQLDDFLSRYEYLDPEDPNTLPEILTLMHNIQYYVNNTYTDLKVSKYEWEEISAAVMPQLEGIDETTGTNHDEGGGFSTDEKEGDGVKV